MVSNSYFNFYLASGLVWVLVRQTIIYLRGGKQFDSVTLREFLVWSTGLFFLTELGIFILYISTNVYQALLGSTIKFPWYFYPVITFCIDVAVQFTLGKKRSSKAKSDIIVDKFLYSIFFFLWIAAVSFAFAAVFWIAIILSTVFGFNIAG